ncbi:MAG: hypothetical protein ACRDRX_20360 [Pseudonocardiaceae bacterium]
MTGEQVGPKVSAALWAQASGLGTGSPAAPPPLPAAVAPSRGRARATSRMPGWVILVLAVVFGAMAGGLAGVLSTW